MKGDKSPRISFTSQVGAGSSSHVLFGAELISFWISSAVTAVQFSSDYIMFTASELSRSPNHTPTNNDMGVTRKRDVVLIQSIVTELTSCIP